MLSSRPASAATPTCSRCFHTDAEGRIALKPDWPTLFTALRELPSVALQSRHTYARLIHLDPLPELTWNEAGTMARDESGELQFRADRWGAVSGRLALCACCDSPGHVEILNQRGGDVLQVCATDAVAPAAWAACLEPLVDTGAAQAPGHPQVGFPLVPESALPLRETVDLLPALLMGLANEGVPVRFTVRTPEVLHRREFLPRRVSVGYPLLTATNGRTTMQVALPPVQNLALDPAFHLYLAGPGNTVLLALGPGEGAREPWRAALAAAFPSSRSLPSS